MVLSWFCPIFWVKKYKFLLLVSSKKWVSSQPVIFYIIKTYSQSLEQHTIKHPYIILSNIRTTYINNQNSQISIIRTTYYQSSEQQTINHQNNILSIIRIAYCSEQLTSNHKNNIQLQSWRIKRCNIERLYLAAQKRREEIWTHKTVHTTQWTKEKT